MNMPCATRIDCPCDSTLANLSAYDEDAIRYKSQAYSNEEPRIDHKYEAIGCVSTCQSDISQEDADLCAQNQALQCVKDGETDENDDPVAGCWNSAQTATVECPDGEVTQWTVAAGTILADNCPSANAAAYSIAQQQALLRHICISCAASACVGEYVQFTFVGSGGICPCGWYIWSLPVGFSPVGDPSSPTYCKGRTLTIEGYASNTPGAYPFVLEFYALTPDGEVSINRIKHCNLYVGKIDTAATLPSGEVGEYYTETLQQTGIPVPQWNIVSGSLPDGLYLDPDTGVILGTPTESGTFTFTVEMTDET